MNAKPDKAPSGESGYGSAEYAWSLAHLGDPIWLPNAEGWLLRRRIPGTELWDAIGCYPLFTCRDWECLQFDLSQLTDLVSVTAVVDPLSAERAGTALASAFPDLATPYKQHFLVDLQSDWTSRAPRNHQRNAKKALSQVGVQRCSDPGAELGIWCDLYAGLKRRHAISALADFPRHSFAQQLDAPGLVMLKATDGTQTVAMQLWFMQGETAYFHLGASSDDGYRLSAAFALMWSALHELQRAGARWATLGGAPGARASGDADGLARFKQGWATRVHPAYLCGFISDRPAYDDLIRGIGSSSFFPAYRSAPATQGQW